MEAQIRMNMMKDYVQKIYGEIIRSAMYGETNYTFVLYNQPYLQDKKDIIELLNHYEFPLYDGKNKINKENYDSKYYNYLLTIQKLVR